MQIAILRCRNLIGHNIENRLRRVTRIEILPINLTICDNFYEFYSMFFFHVMCYLADLDFKSAVDFLDHRHVFFFRGINRIFGKQLHGLSAANQLPGTAMQDFNDIATEITLVNLVAFGHFIVSFLMGWRSSRTIRR